MSLERRGRRMRLFALGVVGLGLTVGLGAVFRSTLIGALVFTMVAPRIWWSRHDPRPLRELAFWLPMGCAMAAGVLWMESAGCLRK